MKRIGGLFDAIATRENLGRATWAAAAGKRHRPEVQAFLADLDHELAAMARQLQSGNYRFSPYRSFEVRDTKRRTIHAPSFRDRVAHHAMIAVAGPELERGALVHSYACRRGRGQHAALQQAAQWTRRGHWYGKMDVRKFYDSVDHTILLRLLARRFREQRLMGLFEHLLASYQSAPATGLPIGALTSQYLGNFLLDAFDHALKATGKAGRYLRYMDDAVVWTRHEADLALLRNTAIDSLGQLGLTLKNGGEWNRCDQGLPFLGFVVYPDRLRLGKQGRKRLRRKFSALARQWRAGQVPEQAAQARAQALFAHATSGHDHAWRQTVLAFHDFGEAQGPLSRPARRQLEQPSDGLPLRIPQQEQARQPEQEHRFSPGLGPRIGAADAPDDAPSCAPVLSAGAEAAGEPPPGADTCRGASRKAAGGAPLVDPNRGRP